MSTGTNIAIGVGAAAVVGFGIYWFFIREAEEVAGEIKKDETGSGGGGSGSTGGRGDSVVPGIKPPPRYSRPITATIGKGEIKIPSAPATAAVGKGEIKIPSAPVTAAVGKGRGANGSVSWINAMGYM